MGQGYKSYIGWVEEPSWGTPVAPVTKFAELVSEDLTGIRTRTPRPIIRRLDDVSEGELYDEKHGAEGGFSAEANYEGMLRLFEHLFGDSSVASAVLEAATSWTHTITLKDTIMSGKGLTLNLDTDTDNGSTPVKQVAGYKVNSCVMSFDPTRNAQLQFSGAGKDLLLLASPTPTYPGIANYVAGHALLCEIDDVARSIDTAEITIDNGLDLDKRILGSKNIDEPIRGGAKRSISGTIAMDAVQADQSKFLAGTLFKLELLHTGPALGANFLRFDLTMPKCEVTEDPVRVESFGVIKSNFRFRALLPTSGERITLAIVNSESVVA